MSDGKVLTLGPGDVTGPVGAVDGAIAVFDGDTGKLIADSGHTVDDLPGGEESGDVVGPASAVDDRVAIFDGLTGKLIADGGKTIAEIIAAASVAPPAPVAQNTFLVSGGAISWESAYTFRVAAAQYYIAGVLKSSAEQTVTLDAADATYDRIDVIVVNSSGVATFIKGTAADQPSEPEVDPATELKLGIVLVLANTSAPDITTTALWTEQAGSPTEWDWSSSGSGWTIGSTNNPRTGSKCIEGTSVAKNAYVQAQIGSGSLDPNAYDVLVIFVRSKAAWPSNRGLRVQWYASGTALGTGLIIATGYWGFDSAQTTGYQMLSLPIPQFAVPAGRFATQLRITDTNGAIGFYLDDIVVQQGTPGDTTVVGITMAQADARYQKLPSIRKVGLSLDGGATAITTGVKGSIQVDFAGSIIGWSIQADQAGDLTVEVSKKAGTQTAPAVPDAVNDKIGASAPIALSSAQAAGVGPSGVATWTTAVSSWDSIQFKVATAVTVTRATLWLRIQES